MQLDAQSLDYYREHGAVRVKNIFSADSLELLMRGVEKNIEQRSDDNYHRMEEDAAFIYDYGCHRWIAEYSEFIRSTNLGQAAAQILASQRAYFFDDSYFLKEAGTKVVAPWHHDFSYYEIDGEILVAWIPLDPHGEYETLRLVSGSHGWGKRFWPAAFEAGDMDNEAEALREAYDPLPDIDAGNYQILAWEVAPGDCVFFNGLTLHSSRGNPTDRDQRRFNCRFVNEHARYAPRADYPWSDGKVGAKLLSGQPLCQDPDCFVPVWGA